MKHSYHHKDECPEEPEQAEEELVQRSQKGSHRLLFYTSGAKAILPFLFAAGFLTPSPPVFISKARAADQALEQSTVDRASSVRPLPGALDDTEVFNSNSPEIVRDDGILLSTFARSAQTGAHLPHAFNGRFDVFVHHINNGAIRGDRRTVHVGLIFGNAGHKKVHIKVLQAASYVSQPDAPFIEVQPLQEDPAGKIFSGPGDRVTSDMLRGKFTLAIPPVMVLRPHATYAVDLPIPINALTPPVNGRSALLRLKSNGPVYVASVAKLGAKESSGGPLSVADWQAVLESDKLANPRDVPPTDPKFDGPIKYGRVAGVSVGARWQGTITTGPNDKQLSVSPGDNLSFVIASVEGGTLGTNQIQSAPLQLRYPDTAYSAHGNYAVQYDLAIPLFNPTQDKETVAFSLESPIKNFNSPNALRFYNHPPSRIFFRGVLNVRCKNKHGKKISKYFHIVLKKGEEGMPFFSVIVPPGKTRDVEVHFLYPPDATPPQVLTIKSKA